jgi:transposase
MAKALTADETKRRLAKLRNYENVLYPAARARIDQLVTENKALKQQVNEQQIEIQTLQALIQKLSLQVEMLNTKVFGKQHKHGNDDQGGAPPSVPEKQSKSPRPASSYRRAAPGENEVTGNTHHPIDTSDHSPHAGHTLSNHKTVTYFEEDVILPSQVSLKTVTEHSVEARYCENCHRWLYGADIPQQPVILGANLPKLVSFLSVVARFSYQQIVEHVGLFYHIKLTDGLIGNMLESQAAKLRPAYEDLIESILAQNGVHFDESTWKMLTQKLGHYVWVMTGTDNRDAAYFFGQSRGKGVLEKMLAPLKATGKKIIGISDDYGAYKNVEAFLAHALCWAHPNRKLRDLAESKTLPEATRAHCETVYLKFNALYWEVNELWVADVSEPKRTKRRHALEARFSIIAKSQSKDPPELTTYKDTLRSNKEAYFVCLKYPGIPPDNNKAERAIRHLVIKRKACGGSKTQKGADILSVLYSVLLSLYWRNPADYFAEYDKLLTGTA